jgi:drug/metabolite transporter (DMT)-like permease
MSNDMVRPDRFTLAAFALVILFGGGNAVAVRFTVAELPPFWGAGLRFAITAAIFWGIALTQRIPMPRGRTLAVILLYGFLQIGASYALIYWGIRQVPAGLTMVILALTPLLTLFFAFFHGMETFRWRGLLGAVLAFAGIVLAFVEQPDGGIPFLSLLAVIGGAACFAEATVVIKWIPKSSPIMTNALAMSTGTAVLLGLSLLAGEPWRPPALAATWGAIGYLILFGSVIVFYLFILVVRRWTASATSYAFVLMPFVTVVAAAWLADEAITWLFVIGGVMTLVGVWVGAINQRGGQSLGNKLS